MEGSRNVISGNGGSGIAIVNPGASGNEVMGNYLGTDKDGEQNLGNDIKGRDHLRRA